MCTVWGCERQLPLSMAGAPNTELPRGQEH